jgi:hypothetical protein
VPTRHSKGISSGREAYTAVTTILVNVPISKEPLLVLPGIFWRKYDPWFGASLPSVFVTLAVVFVTIPKLSYFTEPRRDSVLMAGVLVGK